jgi:site-specific recombinase XerD
MTSDDDRPADPNGSEPVGEHVRIYRRGRVWYANYQAGRKQHRVSLKTTNKKAALRKALRIDTELATGQWKPATETATVEVAIAAYLEKLRADDLAPKTLGKYEMLLKRIGAMAVARNARDVSHLDLGFVDAYRIMRTKAGANQKTIYGETVFLRQLVNFALTRNMVEKDPLLGIKLKKPKPTRQPCWTAAEVTQILAAAPSEVLPALTLLAETGMRFGELQWLTWDDVELRENDGAIHVRQKDGWRPKSGDQRTIPLSVAAQAVLRLLPRTWRWVVTMMPSQMCPSQGRQWTERRLLAALKSIIEPLGLPGKLHTFRHYFISNALLNGMPEAMVRKWVGHVDAKIMEIYTHMNDDASQAAMQRLTEANSKLQVKKESQDGEENGSAQS